MKSIVGPFVLSTALAMWICGCSERKEGFVASLENAAWLAHTNGGSVLRISKVTDFEWEKLYVFAPYTPISQVHSRLGFKWKAADETKIESSDTFFLLVFVRDNNVVRHFNIPRTVGDFGDITKEDEITFGDDAFNIKSVEQAGTKRWLFMRSRGVSSIKK
jgi:hypothetical protein